MSNIKKGFVELIGHTPLLEPAKYDKAAGISGARVLVKLEAFNPAGSVKDRVALQMIVQAEKDGKLKPGATIIEPTSGNTGIGIAAVAAARGYHAILTLPETMSVERRQILKAYGAELVLTDGSKGMPGAIAKAAELQKSIPGSIILGQFENPANVEAHFTTTGPEIWEDTDGQVDFFVAGVGTGGTLTGAGKFLKSKNPNVKVIAVEPDTSAVLSGEKPGPHKIQALAQASSPRFSIPASMMRSSGFRTRRHSRTAGSSPIQRDSWSESPQALRSMRQASWQRVRRTRARPLWPCCLTPATATSPALCLPEAESAS